MFAVVKINFTVLKVGHKTFCGRFALFSSVAAEEYPQTIGVRDVHWSVIPAKGAQQFPFVRLLSDLKIVVVAVLRIQ